MEQNHKFVVEQIITGLGIKTDLGRKAAAVMVQNLQLLDCKQLDYGRANLDRFGSYGVLVRLNDKVSRMTNLLQPGMEANYESISDTWQDAANYSVIGQILTDEEES
jgi:hypothetical protein